jgi:hypothetical protein
MINFRRLGSWGLAVLLFILVSLAVTYAFAAANTMPANTYAGDGSNTISGYTISNIHYTLDEENPSYLSATNSIQFTISPAMNAEGTVRIQLSHGGATAWYDCDASGGANITCNVEAGTITVAGITNLRVVAAQ